MKKSQRARLAELTNKAEAERTAVEKAEFAFLSALATQHPDASKDIDDTTPAGATNATQPPTSAASPAAGANAPPTAAQPGTLRGFIQSLRTGAQTGTALVTAQQSVATLTTERDQSRVQVATLTAQVTAFAAFFGITAAELAGMKGAEVGALIQQKISAQALEVLAGTGVPINQLPAQGKGEGAADAPAELLKQYSAITDPVAKAEFYEKNKAALFGGKN